MIEVYYQNGTFCLYNVEDWEVLRKTYRIVGEFLGATQSTPALPIKLLVEEVILLLNKGIIKLKGNLQLDNIPSTTNQQKYQDFFNTLLCEERIVYKDIRKKELENVMDKVMKGKKRKKSLDESSSKSNVFEEELNKSCNITEADIIWPIRTMSNIEVCTTDIPVSSILNLTNKLKCSVFADLWEKGYYITTGNKFGGDFLAYLGDPILFHAAFIVQCLKDSNKGLYPTELVSFGRLGTSVKKQPVFAVQNEDDSIKYITIEWFNP